MNNIDWSKPLQIKLKEESTFLDVKYVDRDKENIVYYEGDKLRFTKLTDIEVRNKEQEYHLDYVAETLLEDWHRSFYKEDIVSSLLDWLEREGFLQDRHCMFYKRDGMFVKIKQDEDK